MKNQELAAMFDLIASLLEVKGEDRFRVNSYRRVARTLGDLSDDIEAMAARGAVSEIPGVGKSTAAKIEEYLKTGKMAFYDEVRSGLPEKLPDLLRISGMGPKTVALLHKERGIGSLEDLAAALAAGKLAGLAGMGEKKIENIRTALAELLALCAAGAGSRTLLGIALPAAAEVADRLRGIKGVSKVEIGGSLRRRRETIGDIDFLVCGDDGARILAEFVKFPQVAGVLGRGDTKASIKTALGLQMDVRVVPAECWGAALQYFTGSKDHNVRLREIAIKKGLKLSEWGLFRGEERIAGATEDEVYAALGLPWIPPEMREDRGELDAAAHGRLPALVELGDIRGDLHMHTTASDGKNSILEMAAAAKKLGYQYIAITDHSQSLGVARGLDPARLKQHIADIKAAGEQIKGIRILAGTESDIREDGSLDYDDDLLAQLDIVIGSIHGHMKLSREDMTKRVIKAVSNPHMRVFGHPTARYIDRRPPVNFDMEAVIAACKAHGVAMEINASMERLDLSDIHARAAVEAGVPIMIDTDSHAVEGLASMTLGVATARRGWVKKSDVLNTKPKAEFLKWLERGKS